MDELVYIRVWVIKCGQSAPAHLRSRALLAELAPRSARGATYSYFRAFSQGESVVDVCSTVADRVLHFAVP